ncbi:MAG: sigma-54-dependent transcriptional regulator [Thermoanaerobaculia bacterium]
MNARLIIVDDAEPFTLPLSAYLQRAGYSVTIAATLSAARAELMASRFDAILLDLALPDGNGLDWIPALRKEQPEIALVVITGTDEISVAVEAMRRGADHFVTKPVDLGDLALFLRKSLEIGTLRRHTAVSRLLTRQSEMFFGESPVRRSVLELAHLASASDTSVLITGETGTGKGVLARWIHQQSSRHSMPYVEVNCSTLHGDLLGSTLFGHRRGAFTSAVDDRPGLLDAADRGTLFLDEIGDMELTVQGQFLKAVEERRYRRLGEVQTRSSDFRLIAATNRDLSQDVQSGRFRQDLFYRIDVLPLRTPPLREMRDDIPDLARYLLRTLDREGHPVHEAAMRRLLRYDWPGNIRELRNVLERALLLSRGAPIGEGHLVGLDALAPAADASPLPADSSRIVTAVLQRVGGNKALAAQELGISRATLYRRLKDLERRHS